MTYKFIAMIFTHGRPERVLTYRTLRKAGYTGPIILIIDNEDKTADKYKEIYGDEVYVFDKLKEAKTTDACDNFQNRRAEVYVRNAAFWIAKELGYEYFLQLDDDYKDWHYRVGKNFIYNQVPIKNLDRIFQSLFDFFVKSRADAIAIAQGGDFIGGSESSGGKKWYSKRKCMNTWFCHTDKPLTFCGRMNEDCSQYTVEGHRGKLFLQINMVSINQIITQAASGGMSELYQDAGTYLKTFYTIMQAPSCTKIRRIGLVYPRIHHEIQYNNCCSKIIREEWKKA